MKRKGPRKEWLFRLASILVGMMLAFIMAETVLRVFTPAALNRIAKAKGAKLLIAYIPHRSQVHPGLRQDRHVISEYFNNLDRLLGSHCEQNNISYVNLLPHLINASGKGQQLYYVATSAHWNPNGHELAARVIYDFLAQELSAKERR
jgi:hypothetical protein